MRFKIQLSGTDKPLPIEHHHIVIRYIHRVLGKDNVYHDAKNDYSISSLIGGKLIPNTKNISFKKGGYIIISSQNQNFLNDIMMNFYTTEFYGDIKVTGVEFIQEQFNNGWNHFAVLPPGFIIKDYKNKKEYGFHTLNDENFETIVKNYLIKKLFKIDPTLNLSDFDVRIVKHDKHKVNKVMIKNVKNIANLCHISIHSNKKVAEILYHIGIGQSTGCGFGVIYKTENGPLYRN